MGYFNGYRSTSKHRLPNYDYNRRGYYFVTIGTHGMRRILGEVREKVFYPSEYGKLCEKYLEKIPLIYPKVNIVAFIVMPHHIHSLLHVIRDSEPSLIFGRYGLVSKIIKGFKEAVTKDVHENFNDYEFRWKKSFYDKIVWHPDSENIEKIKQYIKNNPKKWKGGENN